MTDVQPPRHRTREQAPPPPPEPAWTLPTTPIAAGFAVLCAATALSGVVQGVAWLFYLLIAIGLVVGTGMLLRSLRTPPPLVVLGELFALLCLVTMSFSTNGILLILPGPTALGDIVDVLGRAVVDVQTEVPPVPADQPILCLIVIAIGMVAVVVDMLAVEAEAPAASGLVLLCVYAVPASLADEMLPWWSFLFGAASFATLLAVDGRAKHRAWRGRRTGLPGYSQGAPNHEASAVVLVAIVLALIVGSTFTVIGTVGRLPGGGSTGDGSGPFGVKPYTKLQGLLTGQSNQEFFRVTGLKSDQYLRLVTLDKYVENDGWQIGVPINGGDQLGTKDLESGTGPVSSISIQPNQFDEQWAPVYGSPVSVSGLGSEWRWDPTAETLWTSGPQQFGAYVERARMTPPSADQLRAEGTLDESQVDPRYRQPVQVDGRVRDLINQVTAGMTTSFDKVRALTLYLNSGENGFKYSLDARVQDTHISQLDDFLFNTKTGFCEQYASALAVMTRAMGIPTRVAIGFTPGVAYNGDPNVKTITGGDAHAWVEVLFPHYGWTTFDPTPAGSRVVRPPYMADTAPSNGNNAEPSTKGSAGPTSTAASQSTAPSASVAPVDAQSASETSWLNSSAPPPWVTGVIVVLAIALTVLVRRRRRPGRTLRWLPAVMIAGWGVAMLLIASYLSWWLAAFLLLVGLLAAPATVRAWRRRMRLRQIAALGSQAASAAWAEVLAESTDRGTTVPATETVRAAGRRLARDHELDDAGREALRQVITAVEGSWYGGRAIPDPKLVQAVADLRAGLHRTAPLAFTARVLPRSVINRR
jgi:hypothetical protein